MSYYCSNCKKNISQAEYNYSTEKFKRALCYNCQKQQKKEVELTQEAEKLGASRTSIEEFTAQYGVDKDGFDKDLFEKLRELRTIIAKTENVPAYCVFNDSTLTEMALQKPQDYFEMENISGIGEVKLDKYGELFLEVIIKHLKEKGLFKYKAKK